MSSGSSIVASVIVPVHNDPAGLARTLEALARQTVGQEMFETIVVDDASTDATPTIALSMPGVRLVRRERSGGSYVARNAGVRLAEGEFLAFTDADCRPDPTWLARGIARLYDERDAVVGGQVRMPLGDRPTIAAMVDVVHHLDQQRYVEDDGYAVTANLLMTRETFDVVGPFDETLRSGGDREFTTRARAAGRRLVFGAGISVVHPPRASAVELRTKSKRVGRGSVALREAADSSGRPPYLRLHAYWPRHRSRGRVRVAENGAEPGHLRWFLVGVGQVLWVQIPQAREAFRSDLNRLRRFVGRLLDRN